MNKQTKYKPNFVSPPGETLQELLEQFNLSQADLAERTGRPKKTINEIIQGKAAITPETALQFQRVLKTPAHFWLAREAKYRAWIAEQDDDHRLKGDIEQLSQFPVKEMIQYRWIPNYSDKLSQLKELLTFFGVTSVDKIPLVEQVAFRKSEAFAINPWALAAWLRKGEIDSIAQECAPFSKTEFINSLKKARSLTNEMPNVFVPKLTALCNASGVAITFTKELPKTSVCGATRWLNPDRPLLQLSLRYKSNDHFWFSFFHEAAHICLGHAKREVLLEGSSSATLDHREIEANSYANDLLIPKAEIARLSAGSISEAAIRDVATKVGITPALVVGRLQNEKVIRFNQFNGLKMQLCWEDWPTENESTDF